MNKRDDIVDAARFEFCQYDFESASVNRIIKAANTSKGNFYHFFSNKEDLYIELMKEAWRKKTDAMHAEYNLHANECRDIFEWLKLQVMAGIKFSHKNPELYQLSRRFAKESGNTIYVRVMEEIQKEQEQQKDADSLKGIFQMMDIRDDIPKDFALEFISFLMNNINDMMKENDDINDMEKKIRMTIEILKNGLSQKE